jgi:uncharacterized protein (TIGR03437 family)
MKGIIIPAFLVSIAFLSPRASAGVATFGASAQTVTLSGLGGNGQGEGQSNVTWGSCVFNDANTQCTVSAPYTGVGGGGTIGFVITYPGNGPAPLTATSITPGGDYVNLSLTAGSFVVTLTETNGTVVNFYQTPNWNFVFSNPTCTGVVSCAVGQVGLTQNATITGSISGAFDTTPVIQSAVSASGYGGFSAIAPGTWMEIYGENLATVRSQLWAGSDFTGNLGPTALGGTTVTIGGQLAYIDYVSPGQVNAQVASSVATGSQPVVVTTAGGSSLPFTITVNTTEPGLLAPPAFKLSAGQYVVALFPDGSTFVLPPGALKGVASARAKPGDTIVLYGIGFGTVTPDSPAGEIVTVANTLNGNFQASFAGTPAKVSYSGLTGGYLGLYQFNVVVPNVAPSDTVPFTFSLGGNAGTQTLLIAIGN